MRRQAQLADQPAKAARAQAALSRALHAASYVEFDFVWCEKRAAMSGFAGQASTIQNGESNSRLQDTSAQLLPGQATHRGFFGC